MPIGGALLGSAVIGAGASVYAGSQQSKSAANALAMQKQMYDQTRADNAPFMNVGKGALMSLGQLYGIDKDGNATGQPFNPDSIKAFENSPDYKFAFDQGNKALTFSNAAKGLLKSGGNLKDIVQFGQGQATQNFQNYANRLLQLSGIGQAAASGNANSAAGFSGQMSGSINQQGAANASGVVGAANAASGALGTYGNQLYLQNLMTSMRGTGAGSTGASFPVGGSNPVPYAGAGGLPGYADGGQAPGEQDIIVGERGPEVIRLPPGGGEVIPNELARASLATGGFPNDLATHAIATGMADVPGHYPALTTGLDDYSARDPNELAALRMRNSVRPIAGRAGEGPSVRDVFDATPVGLAPAALDTVIPSPINKAAQGADGNSLAVARDAILGGASDLGSTAGRIASSVLGPNSAEAGDRVRPSQQQQVLVDSLQSRMTANDTAIQKLRDSINANVSKIGELGTTMTKSPAGTQAKAQAALENANSSAQTQLTTLLADQKDLGEAHGKASDALTEMLNTEHNEDRATAEEGKSSVDKYPWTKALPYAGGATALALAMTNRGRAIGLHNEYVDRIVEATKKAENAIKKNVWSPVAEKRVQELRNLERGYESVQSETRTKLGPLFGNALAGGAVATELGFAPFQYDRTMPEGTAGRTKADAMTDFTNPEMWKQAGWSAAPGVSGAAIGAEIANFVSGKHLPDLERASAVISNYEAAQDMGPKEYRARSQGGSKMKTINVRPNLRLIGR